MGENRENRESTRIIKKKKQNIRQLETGVTAALVYPDRKNTVAVVLDAPARLGEDPYGRQPTAADIDANHHGDPDGEIPEPGLGHGSSSMYTK